MLIFGPGRIGELGTELGKGIRGFKEGIADDDELVAERTHDSAWRPGEDA